MTLKEDLFELFQRYHKGKQGAIKIRDLVLSINLCLAPEYWQYKEREVRQGYEDLPICGSSRGLYLPETQDEIDEQIELHMKKVYAYWRKIKILREYKIKSDPIQKDLF